MGLPSSTNEGNLCEKEKKLGNIGSFTTSKRFFLYLIRVVLTVLIESKRRQGGKIVSKEILLSDSPFLSFSSLGTTIFIWFSDIVRPCYSLLLRPRNSLFIYDSG